MILLKSFAFCSKSEIVGKVKGKNAPDGLQSKKFVGGRLPCQYEAFEEVRGDCAGLARLLVEELSARKARLLGGLNI